MFSFAIGRPLVRWADLPGRVVASPPCHAASGRLIANTGLLAGNGRPHRLDDALMLPCCGSDRLIILKGLKPGIDRSLSYLPHTHTHTRTRKIRTSEWVGYGGLGAIRLSGQDQGGIRGISGSAIAQSPSQSANGG